VTTRSFLSQRITELYWFFSVACSNGLPRCERVLRYKIDLNLKNIDEGVTMRVSTCDASLGTG